MAGCIREKSCWAKKKKITLGTDGTPGVSLGILPHYHEETLITPVLCPSGRLRTRVSEELLTFHQQPGFPFLS